MLIYKLNAIQSQILTCFFPPWNIILPELPEQIGHALLNLFPKEKRRTEVHFSTFSTCSHVGWFSSVLWWLHVHCRSAASSPVLSTSAPLPSHPSGTLACPEGRECWREPTEFSVYFSTACNWKLSVF